MDKIEINVSFQPTEKGSTKGHLIVRNGDELLHADMFDLAKDKARTTFLGTLKKLCPAIDIIQIRSLILSTLDKALKQNDMNQPQITEELDVSYIVRPHLFHVPQVSGILVPIAQFTNSNQLDSKWLLHIQWADGQRESIDLVEYLELPDGNKLWMHPRPTPPAANNPCQWSAIGRKRWLEGHTPKLEEIFHGLFEQFEYFLEFSAEDALGTIATLTLWTMLTYVYPAWPAVPYLSIGGPLGSGKSRVFDVLSKVVLRPLPSSNMTAACLFRTLHTQGGVLLLDEAERLRDRTPEAGEIRSILLGGYKRNSKANRLERVGDSFQMISFDVYGPKAVAAIGSLPTALTSRCIKIMMFRAGKNSPIPQRRIDENKQIWCDLCDDLYAMALSYGRAFVEMSSWQPKCEGINGRDLEVWQPVMAIAKLVEEAGVKGLFNKIKDHAVKSLESIYDEVIPEKDEIVLKQLVEDIQEKPYGITAGELLKKVKEEDISLFSRYSPRGIGAILNRYGIKAHRSGGKRYFNPTDKQLKAIEESYGIELGVETETNLLDLA